MVLRKAQTVRVKDPEAQVLPERLFIGTLGVNCIDYTKRTINTVQTDCEEVRFVYIDNGSKDEVCDELKSYECHNDDIDQFDVGFNGRNAGVGPGWNQLIKLALDWGATKILICNNDIAFGRYTIDGMVNAYNRLREDDHRTVMVTATNQTKNPNELKNIPQKWNNHEHPDFSCFMITPETVERVGMFSEEYLPAFFEDNAYHWTVLARGYKAWGTDWAPYSHIASRTRHGNPELTTHRQFRDNKVRFFLKWMTNTCDQEVIVARYEDYISSHPDDLHPTVEQVMDHYRAKAAPELLKWLENLSWKNVPN